MSSFSSQRISDLLVAKGILPAHLKPAQPEVVSETAEPQPTPIEKPATPEENDGDYRGEL